ncbi:hypothetical protein [Desulfococcus sp.]|uniref:hypothetical protein n=1 Tax=Desulfococcus sp. TaxID=2025834 RepID=UPI0035948713
MIALARQGDHAFLQPHCALPHKTVNSLTDSPIYCTPDALESEKARDLVNQLVHGSARIMIKKVLGCVGDLFYGKVVGLPAGRSCRYR